MTLISALGADALGREAAERLAELDLDTCSGFTAISKRERMSGVGGLKCGDRSLRIVIAAVLGFGVSGAANAQSSPAFTGAQAERAQTSYDTYCAVCHGADLFGGPFGPPLRGVDFRRRWAGVPLLELFEETRDMPPGQAGVLGDDVYADLVALVLSLNDLEAGDDALVADRDRLAAQLMPGERAPADDGPRPGGGLTPGAVLPFWPTRPNPLDRIRPVTDELLESPPDGSWLQWRRTHDANGHSPLAQINRDNVASLGVAWSLALPPGPNAATPLVHDDVMFLHAFGDRVLALDARTGDVLWHYERDLPEGVAPSVKRNLSIHGGLVYSGTSDAHVVALDMQTGEVVWDAQVGDVGDGHRLTGGPLVARGVVMQGTVGRTPGGPQISGLDAATGEELWRFHTIARPGEPGGETWNDLPLEERNGGSVWTAGYFDPENGLAFFGPAPTYDTGPLRDPVDVEGVNNDALYTNATVALDVHTGELVWHFQHLPNDQWDLDWSFERQLIEMEYNGEPRRLVLTGGKQAVFDAVDAATGEYAFSLDMGIQNLVLAIDPETGAKIIDETLIPGDGETKTVCPHAGGGKSWPPAAYDPDTGVLYVQMAETCMDLTPVPEGEQGNLSTGVRWSLQPPEASDGLHGRLQAVDVATGETLWTVRERYIHTTGLLSTAGGLVFAGSLDRRFGAYDGQTGERLWETRLSDVPAAAPITYTVNGRQYLAMVVGHGSAHAATFPPLYPELAMPPTRSSSVWVFALPE